MKVTVKQLKGGEYSLEIVPDMFIAEIKNKLSKILNVSSEQISLLLLGKALSDDKQVSFYSKIKDQSKLILVVKKPEGPLESVAKFFKTQGFSDTEASNKAKQYFKILEEKVSKLSLDDLQRLASDILDEDEENIMRVEETNRKGVVL